MSRIPLAVVVLAQAAGQLAPNDWESKLSNLTSFAVLVAVLWWVLTKYLPSKDASFKDALDSILRDSAEQRATFEVTIDKMQERCAARSEKIIESIRDEQKPRP